MKSEGHRKILNAVIFIIVLCVLQASGKAQTSGLPLLDMNKNKFNFGKTTYMDTKTDKLTLKNIGDTVLTIYSIDSVKPPFYAKFIFPDTLEKDDSVNFRISYQPFRASVDSQRIFLRADTRLSYSIGMLFDVSISMNDYMPAERVTKLSAAVSAGKSFINEMLLTPKIWDEAAVFWFASTFSVNQDFTSDKTLLRNALPSNTRSGTAFYDACVEVINRLNKRQFQKVMIALTDGEDNQSKKATESSVISIAKANKIRIYTIGIGSSNMDNSLKNIANSTGGEFFKATTSKELSDIYYKIFKMLSKNITLYFDVLGYSGAPAVTIDCKSDTSIAPGDTISYDFYLNGVSATGAMNRDYNLALSFNSKVMNPVFDGSYVPFYYHDNKLIIHKKNEVDIDSFPLINVKFQALIGDSACSDLKVSQLSWENNLYEPVKSDNVCRLCIDACVKNIRAVQRINGTFLLQNTPNPFRETSEITFIAGERDFYTIEISDVFGRKLKELYAQECDAGEIKLLTDLTDLSSGIYIYTLKSSKGTHQKQMVKIE